MKLTTLFIEKVFEDVKKKYEEKILKDLPNIFIIYTETHRFMKDARSTPINQWMIEKGVFEDFNSEYPSFACVYEKDKSYTKDETYFITICFDHAKELLDKYEEYKVECYLSHVLAHEITHVVNINLREHYPFTWKSALESNKGNTGLADEALAEKVAMALDYDTNLYGELNNALWGSVAEKLRLKMLP